MSPSPSFAEAPYGHFISIKQVLLWSGPVNLLVLMAILLVALILVSRRLQRTRPECSIFTPADVVLALLLIALPLLHAVSLLSVGYLSLIRGGVDADVPFLLGVHFIHLHSSGAVIALLAILIASLIQYLIRRFRRRSAASE